MMDIFTPDKRHYVMSRIRGKDTKPEIRVRSLLHRMGFRFRLHSKALPGHPDIVLPKWKTVIFVHGCFFHRHQECRAGQRVPDTNTEFWKLKFERNIARDQRTNESITALGWRVIVIWECETGPSKIGNLALRLSEEITKDVGERNA